MVYLENQNFAEIEYLRDEINNLRLQLLDKNKSTKNKLKAQIDEIRIKSLAEQ